MIYKSFLFKDIKKCCYVNNLVKGREKTKKDFPIPCSTFSPVHSAVKSVAVRLSASVFKGKGDICWSINSFRTFRLDSVSPNGIREESLQSKRQKSTCCLTLSLLLQFLSSLTPELKSALQLQLILNKGIMINPVPTSSCMPEYGFTWTPSLGKADISDHLIQ